MTRTLPAETLTPTGGYGYPRVGVGVWWGFFLLLRVGGRQQVLSVL